MGFPDSLEKLDLYTAFLRVVIGIEEFRETAGVPCSRLSGMEGWCHCFLMHFRLILCFDIVYEKIVLINGEVLVLVFMLCDCRSNH